jgi:hypothetical protein
LTPPHDRFHVPQGSFTRPQSGFSSSAWRFAPSA